ncbi:MULTISPECIES: isocitrate lyase/PEP mutase family protein [Sphingobium]|jgi:2-methylisocitrate lyase-like PEP mutase family enzyme|uniref:isocitrate lyase/PEP mutase family protein n=1 Tax=Sphingobium TaxID=165695 RepID=UPI000EC6551D|nr:MULTISPECIES: isocitrate lyase/PEP mutase family protein [Sphingobium]MCC4256108.1 isocitrate lyase/PEP mutase family protein [Sphingobium lactosutens]HCW61549.1 carboxyvinyl-carboxyphosphonate phosphorylmutase [Sphingobium sp.]|tara:strand:- start:28598 stop:29482 length:885 start_codon:yes stop_codon:yes gene_type:complete
MSQREHVAALKGLLHAGPDGRRLHSVPGCWDGLTALLVERAGFPITFLSGGALSMGRYGSPDMGLVTASEVAQAVAVIRDRIAIPLIVDADTGFGNALTLQRSLRAFERAGASAVQIEDQGFPKRCGHMAGKTVVPLAESVGRIRAALDARHDMLVIARTDALAVEGYDAAIERAEAYLDAGADLIFIEGPRTLSELEGIAGRFAGRVPLVHNLVEGGVTPVDNGAALEQLGFAIALHPLLLLHGLAAHGPRWLDTLARERGTASLSADIARLSDINALLGASDLIDLGKRYDA